MRKTYRFEIRATVSRELIALAEEPKTAMHNAMATTGMVEIIDNDGRYRYACRLIDGKVQTISPDFKKELGM